MTETPKKPLAITAEDIYAYGFDQYHLLSAEKNAQLHKDMDDPNSYIVRFLQEGDELKQRVRSTDWLARIAREGGYRLGRKQRPKRIPVAVAHERQAIVDFVRQAVEKDRLPAAAAEDVLAEGGESLSWMESVPDRMLLEDLPVMEKLEKKTRNSIIAMRTGLAEMSHCGRKSEDDTAANGIVS
jgi:hypothetical protein